MADLLLRRGPMASGKTRELMEYIRSRDHRAFCPWTEERGPCRGKVLYSRDGDYLYSTPVNPVNGGAERIVEEVMGEDYEAVGIDDAHFFGDELVGVVDILLKEGYDVMVAGLDRDFTGEPFETVEALSGIADEDVLLTADCTECGGDALLTQKMVAGEPAPYDSDQIQSEVEVSYEPRCRSHHTVPGRGQNLSF